MDDTDPPNPSPILLSAFIAISGQIKRSLRFVKDSLTWAWKKISGPEPVFLARLSLRMDLLAFYDSNGNIERYRIQKNGEFPVHIAHESDDSYRRMAFYRPMDNVRSLLFAPYSKGYVVHSSITWSWTSDGGYLRLRPGEGSMLLTFQEAMTLRGILFPESKRTDEIKIDG